MVAHTEAGNGHDHVDGLIERAQDVLDSFERGRTQRSKVSGEVLDVLSDVVGANEQLGREAEGYRRNASHLASRLDATERREEEQRARAEASEDRCRLQGLEHESLRDQHARLSQAFDALRDQHARLSQAFDDFLANLGDGARSLQDEDQRFLTATMLARSRATYGLPDDRQPRDATERPRDEQGSGAFPGLLEHVARAVGEDGRRPPVARLTPDEG